MDIKRKIRSIVLAAAMAAAVIAGTPNASSAELSRKDRIRVTEIERIDKGKYEFIKKQSKYIESLFEKVKENLRKLKVKPKSFGDNYLAFASLSENLEVLDDSVYFSIRELRFKTGLELKKSEDSLKELYDEVYGLMIEYGERLLQTLRAEKTLSERERTVAHNLIDILEKYKERRDARNLSRDLKAVLAESVGRRFP
ncbi:hypothetical protein J4443_01130 [Candidatus Woesearchaeota archaeon]|nr:hypothetical protein [Candidatus Woesearchaeota archaeon]